MKTFDLRTILSWWNRMLPKEDEKKNMLRNEEKATRSVQRLKDFLEKRFEFRYNRLTGVTEYREKGMAGKPFRPIVPTHQVSATRLTTTHWTISILPFMVIA